MRASEFEFHHTDIVTCCSHFLLVQFNALKHGCSSGWQCIFLEFHSFEILNMHNGCDTKMSRFVVLRLMRRHQQLPSASRDFKLQRVAA